MAVQLVQGASQLINSSANINLPVTVPAQLAMLNNQSLSINVWINANWGSTAAPRGTRSFIGLYGPAFKTPGLTGVYYNDKFLTEPPTTVRNDPNINMNQASGASPAPGVNGNAYSIRWTGYWTCPTTSAYWYFRTNSDDGVRVYLNNNLIINNWTDHSATVNTSSAQNLVAGNIYPIVVEYYNQGGEGVITMQTGIGTMFAAPSTYTTIPQSQFNTSGALTQTSTAVQIGTKSGSGEISVWTYGGGVLVESPANAMVNNDWVNVCYTWNGNTHRLYVNGAEWLNSTVEQVPGALKYITINGYWPGSEFETDNHIVDSYSLYNRVLDPLEILTIFNADGARHGIWNGLIANYEFDELPEGADATAVPDLTGGGATLLKVGNAASPKYNYQSSHADSNIRPPVST